MAETPRIQWTSTDRQTQTQGSTEPGSGRNKKRQDIRQGSRNWQKQPGYKTGHSQAETGKTEHGGDTINRENSKQQNRTMQPSKAKTVQGSAKQRNKQRYKMRGKRSNRTLKRAATTTL